MTFVLINEALPTISMLLGCIMTVKAVLGFKAHNENPQARRLGGPVISFVIGCLLMFAPQFF
jgi:hypothetical protein